MEKTSAKTSADRPTDQPRAPFLYKGKCRGREKGAWMDVRIRGTWRQRKNGRGNLGERKPTRRTIHVGRQICLCLKFLWGRECQVGGGGGLRFERHTDGRRSSMVGWVGDREKRQHRWKTEKRKEKTSLPPSTHEGIGNNDEKWCYKEKKLGKVVVVKITVWKKRSR